MPPDLMLGEIAASPAATITMRAPVGADILALPHPDWLYNELTVTGPAEIVAAFQQMAAGTGVVPWHYDYDQLEENWFLLMVAPPPPRQRTISVQGARVLARLLRDRVWELHEAAISEVGRSRACPLDLHSLLPVPLAVLHLGPDHPDALAWLWVNWGTTWPLRRVEILPSRHPADAAEAEFRVGFWSADWTPWPVIRRIAANWPALRLDVRPLVA